ncbi:MAG: hypothetical protein KME27_18730 [Lyngbya sp. HA4199-MV5]|jgi:hypothetical protein|nr:hypothetical protein [Lyngbya sp. HA4199-MV5]
MAPQVIQANGHTLQELAWRLSTVRRKRVPIRTLRWWIEQLHMEPNEYGLYDDSDLAVLISLVLFLKCCRSIAKFKTLLIQELETHAP